MKFILYLLRPLFFCLVCLSPLAVSLCWAQNFPAKPVKFINSFPPGGPVDIIARSLAESMQQSLKQVFVVENRSGAGGNLGADMVAKSAPDGYTVLFGLDTTFTVNHSIYKNSPYKLSDLKPVMIMASSGLLIGVNPSTNIKSMNDLIARGRSQGLTFSSGSNGSPGHLALEILGDLAQIKITHVPYKGNTPAVAAIISGEVDGAVLATPGMLPFVKAQKMNALAVTSLKRSRLAPDVPTVSEVGLKDLALEVFYVAMVPAATPQELVSVLQQSMAEALMRADLKARLESLDLVILSEIGVAASQHLESLRIRYAPIIKSTGMQIE